MREEKNKRLKRVIILLIVLLVVSIVMLTGVLLARYFSHSGSVSVMIPHNIITPEGEDGSKNDHNTPSPDDGTDDKNNPGNPDSDTATDNPTGTRPNEGQKIPSVSLYKRQSEDNRPFQVTNMFPGDRETNNYCVRVYYKGDIIVRYHADIRPGYEKLAEVMKVKIRLQDTDETLYDGLMRDMPASLNHQLKTSTSTKSDLYYEITAYLDTSVGNEYMDQELIADFRWWVEETDHLDSPKTDDAFPVLLVIGIAVSALFVFVLVLFLKKQKKEAKDEQ